MSSFICPPEHFNCVEKSLKALYYDDLFFFPYEFKGIFPALWDRRNHSAETFESQITSIMDTLRSLQATCVCLQYRHHYVGTLDKEIQQEKDTLLTFKGGGINLSKIELYKALQCIRYQIETEHLKELRRLTSEEENAMFFINTVVNTLAADIVGSLPAYQTAQWQITR